MMCAHSSHSNNVMTYDNNPALFRDKAGLFRNKAGLFRNKAGLLRNAESRYFLTFSSMKCIADEIGCLEVSWVFF